MDVIDVDAVLSVWMRPGTVQQRMGTYQQHPLYHTLSISPSQANLAEDNYSRLENKC